MAHVLSTTSDDIHVRQYLVLLDVRRTYFHSLPSQQEERSTNQYTLWNTGTN